MNCMRKIPEKNILHRHFSEPQLDILGKNYSRAPIPCTVSSLALHLAETIWFTLASLVGLASVSPLESCKARAIYRATHGVTFQILVNRRYYHLGPLTYDVHSEGVGGWLKSSIGQ